MRPVTQPAFTGNIYGAFPWMSDLRHHGPITVSAQDQEEFFSGLLCSPALPTLDLPEEWSYEEVMGEPQLCLRIFQPRLSSQKDMLAELSFEYEGRVVDQRTAERPYQQRTAAVLAGVPRYSRNVRAISAPVAENDAVSESSSSDLVRALLRTRRTPFRMLFSDGHQYFTLIEKNFFVFAVVRPNDFLMIDSSSSRARDDVFAFSTAEHTLVPSCLPSTCELTCASLPPSEWIWFM